jgi:hypothetical protein
MWHQLKEKTAWTNSTSSATTCALAKRGKKKSLKPKIDGSSKCGKIEPLRKMLPAASNEY